MIFVYCYKSIILIYLTKTYTNNNDTFFRLNSSNNFKNAI